MLDCDHFLFGRLLKTHSFSWLGREFLHYFLGIRKYQPNHRFSLSFSATISWLSSPAGRSHIQSFCVVVTGVWRSPIQSSNRASWRWWIILVAIVGGEMFFHPSSILAWLKKKNRDKVWLLYVHPSILLPFESSSNRGKSRGSRSQIFCSCNQQVLILRCWLGWPFKKGEGIDELCFQTRKCGQHAVFIPICACLLVIILCTLVWYDLSRFRNVLLRVTYLNNV